MTAVTVLAAPAHEGSLLAQLARKEIVRYLRHPLCLTGIALTVLPLWGRPDPAQSSLGYVIAPAMGLGVFGLVVMASLTRSSDQIAESAGAVAVSERTRTLALALATVVPFAAAIGMFAWAVWAYHRHPALPNGSPFGGIGDDWAYAVLLALGVLPALGGPALGLVIGRWLPQRGAAPTIAVLLVLETVLMQGWLEPVRYIRVIAPWVQFTGPYGVPGDPDRMLIFTGSPQWYAGYLMALTALGVVAALLHDREHPRGRLYVVFGVLVLVAVALCLLAMTTGVQPEMVNPLPSSNP